MNRQEAIQQQIDEIMDTFDFGAVLKVLELYKSIGRAYPEPWTDGGEFQEYLIRMAARLCMQEAAKNKFAGHSYFSSSCHEGKDHDGNWLKLELFFGDRTYNDGVSYE